MPDRDEIIKQLNCFSIENCYHIPCNIKDCGANSCFNDGEDRYCAWNKIIHNAVAMLREDGEKQIPVRPAWHKDALLWECMCGNALEGGGKYCPECGRPLDWGEDDV